MKISIIGAGNMAHQLGKALSLADHDIIEIYNRHYKKGAALAKMLKAKSIKQINHLDKDIDVIIIAVSDDAISEVASQLMKNKWRDVTVVHTSGSVPSTALIDLYSHGVFYPFQSMTAGHDIVFKQIPILVHANLKKSEEMLVDLGESISDKIFKVSDEQRSIIHIAGVFANNFSNHMMALSYKILEHSALPTDIIKPLIINTLQKVLQLDPVKAQTGPAIRRDEYVMTQHLEFFKNQPEMMNLYRLISASIIALDESHKQRTT